ncbi:MAG TPA: MBOAT family O-acyltransferase [Planctomycetota bacterium]|nr:MBOAT family O-acyltransferase [Planctomycetota bacterium]
MSLAAPVFLFLFLPVVLLLGLGLRGRFRNVVLIAGSLVFYLWDEKLFGVLLLASIGINYAIGLGMGRVTDRRAARLLLVLGAVVNLGLLVACKYANFIVANVNGLLGVASIPPVQLARVHLPLGISFFTFQGLSYLVDIYRGEAKPAGGPGQFALYLAFFPKVIAGPIVKYKEIAGQLASRSVNRQDLADGIRRFIIGLGKKIIIANALAVPADRIFALRTGLLTPATAWLGAVCYTLQIYYDFSGYSDMAIGLGRMFGFRLPENFNYPYVSRSIREFWQRWHISLSTWFRDYLYIPLGGNRSGTARTYVNLMIVFLLCGLWHGANWTFVVWGAFQGCFLILERIRKRSPSPPLERGLGGEVFHHAYALLVIIVGWVIFRATTLGGALGYLGAMAGIARGSASAPGAAFFVSAELPALLAVAILGAAPLLPGLAALRARAAAGFTGFIGRAVGTAAAMADLGVMGLILVYSTMLIAAGTYSPFIYAQF